MRLVFGLGNPGQEYESTRHNLGFAVLDFLARREGLLFEPARTLERYEGPPAFLCARLHEPDALLVKPETFMNRSGAVVSALLQWAGAGPERCLVVVDDLDLPLAKLRLRPSGSSGGHNGLKSILSSLGTDRFPRGSGSDAPKPTRRVTCWPGSPTRSARRSIARWPRPPRRSSPGSAKATSRPA